MEISEFTEIQLSLALLQKTAVAWRSSTASERIDRLKKLRTWIKTHQNDIREALWDDFRKSEVETDLSEIFPVTSEINHTIKHLKSWMTPLSLSTPMPMLGTKAKILYEPKGVSLIIAPWNYPFNLAIGPLVSAIAAGCPTIIKPSELTPATSSLIARMISEIFSEGEVQVYQGDAEVAQALLSLPFDHIFFTGSPQIGKVVMEYAAKHLTSVTLELGGKSPCIITESADIKDAAQKIIYGKLVNCGQTCVAPDYILVHQDRKELLLAELQVAIQEMYDPQFKGLEHSNDMARIVNERHFSRLKTYLDDAVEKGAKIEFGGKTIPHHRFIEPTLLSEVNEDMLVAQEEIFGPLLPILTYKTLQEAVQYINKKPKPLALYIFDKSKSYESVLQQTSSGNAVINDCVLHFLHNEMPFGGVNNSGIGKAHGHFGFLAFSNEKGILKQRIGPNNTTLLRPPYGMKTKQIIKSLIKWF
ncbi:aldehyde dehydrogenase family protein [Algoriphagus kandeliae]|uniref:Aldehyde dehydrogenase n=1 Tax=Algoriphagus kandeliae TaxID=2562278 RepID=A0A4Y9QSV4_9BACT|nr:aldehyde dehydrogenase family protein [Algoriphagus kandeliae]TFV95489.1 aldehyde dehydrogenase family protein [Algoriphagus kandeliae]